MSPQDWPKLQEWVALSVIEKQVGEDAGWHHPGMGGRNLVTPDKTTIQFLEVDPEGAFQAE